MSERVLSSGTAVASINAMQVTIDGGLQSAIDALHKHGTTLMDPSVWDGRLAGQFRSEWPAIDQSLQTTRQKLDELRAFIHQVNTNILSAGGNAV